MRARFKGFCENCRKATWPGQEIRRGESGHWVHAVCPANQEPARQVGGGYREMAARFPSECPTCHGAIAENDRIVWKKGEKAVHAACFGEQVPAHPLAPLVEVARALDRPRRHRDPDMALAAENYGDPDDVDRGF